MTSTETKTEKQTCASCKYSLTLDNYDIGRGKTLLKTCRECKEKMRCEHGNTDKYGCKQCCLDKRNGKKVVKTKVVKTNDEIKNEAEVADDEESDEEVDKKTCSYCKKKFSQRMFGESEVGGKRTTCKTCHKKNTCKHGFNKYKCTTCKKEKLKAKTKAEEGSGEEESDDDEENATNRFCKHEKDRNHCRLCKAAGKGGNSLCDEHLVIKSNCKLCKEKGKVANNVCIHDKVKSCCRECTPQNYCEHDLLKDRCRTCKIEGTGGSQICEHGHRAYSCKDCVKQREDDGKKTGICEHNHMRHRCVECNGVGVCCHRKRRSECAECEGSSVCPHRKIRNYCFDCGGASMCKHAKRRIECKNCDLLGYLGVLTGSYARYTIADKLKEDGREKRKVYKDYIECTMETLKAHIEKQFEPGMTWENHGEWHIDHIIPLHYNEDGEEISLDDLIDRLHYINLQPMWASENLSKKNKFIGKKDKKLPVK